MFLTTTKEFLDNIFTQDFFRPYLKKYESKKKFTTTLFQKTGFSSWSPRRPTWNIPEEKQTAQKSIISWDICVIYFLNRILIQSNTVALLLDLFHLDIWILKSITAWINMLNKNFSFYILYVSKIYIYEYLLEIIFINILFINCFYCL